MTSTMIDIETFDTSPTAAIVQIGAMTFGDEGLITGHFSVGVALQSSLLWGCTINVDTVSWWRAQEVEARLALCEDVHDLKLALERLSEWYTPGLVWSHGAAFDIPILHHAYNRVNLEPPWNYRDVRDTRTVYQLARERGWTWPPQSKISHIALDDVHQQVEVLSSALAYLRSAE